jgi:lipopolysaccharide export system permease protein
MRWLLDRYLLRDLFPPFLLGIGVFTFVLLTDRILRLTELVIVKGVELGTVLTLVAYLLPSFLAVTVPMAVLVAVLTGFGRLSADGEITACKAAGVSLYRMARPVLFFALLTGGLTLATMLWLLPHGNHSFKTLLYRVMTSKATIGIEEGVFNETFDRMVLYVHEVSPPTLRGIFLYNVRDPEQPYLIVAREGTLVSDPSAYRLFLRLRDGTIHPAGRGTPREAPPPMVTFKTNDLQIDLPGPLAAMGNAPKGNREKTLGELRAEVQSLEAQGLHATSLRVEVHKKFSIPAACLVFALLGIPLGIRAGRSGRWSSLAVGIGIILLYYILITSGENLAHERRLPAWLAMWSPNLLLGAAGGYLFVLTARERPLPLERALGSKAAALRRSLALRKPR